MKYKAFIVLAAVALVAAGCNRATDQQNQDPNYSQGQNQDNVQNQTQETQNQEQATASNNQQNSPADSETRFSDEGDVEVIDQPEVLEVKMTAGGFVPANLTIKQNDYVQFTNADTVAHWPASAPHPTHTIYPEFDSKQGVEPGKNFRFQFTKTGTWKYHDHLNTSVFGSITVE